MLKKIVWGAVVLYILLIMYIVYVYPAISEANKEFTFGIDAVGFYVNEAGETVDGTPIELQDQRYTLRIRDITQTEYDTVFYRNDAITLGVDSNKVVIIPDSVFGGLGTYEIQVAASRFVEENQQSKKFIDGEFSEPLFAKIGKQLVGTTIKVSWDANTESDLSGYRIYVGTKSGIYSNMIDVGNVIEYFVDGLENSGVTYFFVVTAYDLAGNESQFSEEVFVSFNDEKRPIKVEIKWENE